jgi:hypothetical protein
MENTCLKIPLPKYDPSGSRVFFMVSFFLYFHYHQLVSLGSMRTNSGQEAASLSVKGHETRTLTVLRRDGDFRPCGLLKRQEKRSRLREESCQKDEGQSEDAWRSARYHIPQDRRHRSDKARNEDSCAKMASHK